MLTTLRSPRAHAGLAGLLMLTLAACGGGGGGGGAGSPPPSNVAVTSSNQNAVTRAGLAGVSTAALGGSLGLTGGGQSSALSALAPLARRLVLGGVKRAAAAGRKTIAGTIPLSFGCEVSGSATGSLDDRDNTGTATTGDVLSLTFNNCVDIPGEVLTGRLGATYTQVMLSPLTVGATVAVEDVALADANSSAALNGGFSFTYTEPTLTTAVTRIVVPDQLDLRAQTPSVNDTITMLDGYTSESTYDATAPARTVDTASGPVASAAAGGFVRVTTPAPLVQFDTEDYPHAGQIIATGLTGKLRATVLSNTQVRIELDSDDDGAYDDGTTTVLWTSLF